MTTTTTTTLARARADHRAAQIAAWVCLRDGASRGLREAALGRVMRARLAEVAAQLAQVREGGA